MLGITSCLPGAGPLSSLHLTIYRMKDISFLQSWPEISVCPPCLSLPAPNVYKHEAYRKHLRPSVSFTKPEGFFRSLWFTPAEVLRHNIACLILGRVTLQPLFLRVDRPHLAWIIPEPSWNHIRREHWAVTHILVFSWLPKSGLPQWNKLVTGTASSFCLVISLLQSFTSWTDLHSAAPRLTYSPGKSSPPPDAHRCQRMYRQKQCML